MKLTVRQKNIRDLYRGINDFKKSYKPRTDMVKDEKDDFFADHTVFLFGEGTISPSYWMYLGLVIFSRWIYTKQNH